MPHEHQEQRLANIQSWLHTAKENLPAINEGPVSADLVSEMSALLDRLHGLAIGLHLRMLGARPQAPAIPASSPAELASQANLR